MSIPTNIAEGFSRNHNKEYKQFLYVALGSASELETQLEISEKLRFMVGDQKTELLATIGHLSRMIMTLIKLLTHERTTND